MSVIKQQIGDKWVVSMFVEGHNHSLSTPSKVHLLRSCRNVSVAKKALTQQFSEANIPTCQKIRLMEIDSGGPSTIGFLETHIRNHERDVLQELNGHDADTLVQHFKMEKERSLNFYYDYQTDENGMFIRCFWADCESRRSYAYFGDAVVFDTTYNMNKYSMVFAPFVGVNNHRRTIIFGCGPLSDEKTESFVWFFSKFLEAMSNQVVPPVIITYQDAAISRAISLVMPSTMHRYCLWHILNKFSEKINARVHNDEYHKLVTIIRQSETSDEFEHRWCEVVGNIELSCNEWLNVMYDIRSRWVPTYVKHMFAVGMSSNQRLESGHSFLKKYVNRKNSLMYFIIRFNRALSHQRHEELHAIHIDLSERPRVMSGLVMEKQMAQIYTKNIFNCSRTKLNKVIGTLVKRDQAPTRTRNISSSDLSQEKKLIDSVSLLITRHLIS